MKPIRTAPLDGTNVLIWHGYHGETKGPCSVDQCRYDQARNLWWCFRLNGYIPDAQGWAPMPSCNEELET